MATREHTTSPKSFPPPVPTRALAGGSRMRVEAADRADTWCLVGELDCSTIDSARDALRLPMLRSGPLRLDLSRLTFMGSEGLDLFSDLARGREDIGPVVLSHPGTLAQRLLGIGRLDELPNLRIDSAVWSARTNLVGHSPGTGTRRQASA